MAAFNLQADVVTQIPYEYVLHVPAGTWVFNDLYPNAMPHIKTAGTYFPADKICISVDMITAARLRLIKPGDDSGVSDEQWAWLKLLGLTGESK